MGQSKIMNEIMLTCFKDDKLKELLAIPKKDMKNLVAFRDKYFVPQHGTSNFVNSEIPVRCHIFWAGSSPTSNKDIHRRKLNIDVYVQHKYEFNATKDGLDRRHALITNRLRSILNRKRFGGFLLDGALELDLNSNNYDYYRGYIVFDTKYIS